MEYLSMRAKLSDNITKDKNRLLKKALKSNKNYFFLVEGNCEILDDSVYEKFIEVSKATGIHSLMWAGGGLNKRLPFDDDPFIDYYTDFSTAFTMYTRESIEKVGLFDEDMPPNTWQELEHAKRIGDAELSTPFGMFVSPKGIDDCFKITEAKDEFKNLKQMGEALKYWEEKDQEDFPIEIKEKQKETIKAQPITEMI